MKIIICICDNDWNNWLKNVLTFQLDHNHNVGTHEIKRLKCPIINLDRRLIHGVKDHLDTFSADIQQSFGEKHEFCRQFVGFSLFITIPNKIRLKLYRRKKTWIILIWLVVVFPTSFDLIGSENSRNWCNSCCFASSN